MADDAPLACPRCAARYGAEERFCPRCEMPLVPVGDGADEPPGDWRERARKVKPQYTRGRLVRVGWGRNQAEAELIQGLLLEEGIPSMVRRTRGFDVPDFLAAGPRDILAPESAADDARALLSEAASGTQPADAGDAHTGEQPFGEADAGEQPLGDAVGPPAATSPLKLLAWLLVALAIGSGLFALLYAGSG